MGDETTDGARPATMISAVSIVVASMEHLRRRGRQRPDLAFAASASAAVMSLRTHSEVRAVARVVEVAEPCGDGLRLIGMTNSAGI